MELLASKDQIRTNIEKLRTEMVNVGLINGFGNSYTIVLSQQLDILIFEYQKLIKD
jgi:hypothetical protein